MDKKIILYSTGCPNCKTLKKILESKDIAFEENNSVDEMLSLGFDRVPVLCIDGVYMEYEDAKGWANAYGKEEMNEKQ